MREAAVLIFLLIEFICVFNCSSSFDVLTHLVRVDKLMEGASEQLKNANDIQIYLLENYGCHSCVRIIRKLPKSVSEISMYEIPSEGDRHLIELRLRFMFGKLEDDSIDSEMRLQALTAVNEFLTEYELQFTQFAINKISNSFEFAGGGSLHDLASLSSQVYALRDSAFDSCRQVVLQLEKNRQPLLSSGQLRELREMILHLPKSKSFYGLRSPILKLVDSNGEHYYHIFHFLDAFYKIIASKHLTGYDAEIASRLEQIISLSV